MKTSKTIILLILFVAVLVFGYFVNRKYGNLNPQISTSPSSNLTTESTPSAEPLEVSPVAIPNNYSISGFSFQSQAPLGNWDALHEEACEEASLILVKYWLDDKGLSAQQMESEIQAVVSWETQNGYPMDVTTKQLVAVAKSYYRLDNLSVINNATIDKIKQEIAAGHPVIVPAAGRDLGNPNFTAPGPVYHMVVAIGYEGNNIIVQDVGTRKGDHYKYNSTIFFNAIHDWAGSADKIESGAKNVIVVE
jgi:hypothetical protein